MKIIKYHNPRRPDEHGVCLVTEKQKAATVKDLEARGYVIVSVVTAPPLTDISSYSLL
jgi:hypothetical protein